MEEEDRGVSVESALGREKLNDLQLTLEVSLLNRK